MNSDNIAVIGNGEGGNLIRNDDGRTFDIENPQPVSIDQIPVGIHGEIACAG
ncbi:hypothetical protein D3C81_1843360 [compost metagenome]